MPAPIPNKVIKKIAETIRSWPSEERLSWDAICQSSKLYLDYVPTRQALSSKSVLSFEYKSKKEEIRARTQKSPNQPKNMATAVHKIQQLEKDISSLNFQIDMLHETLQRMIYNSALHKLSKVELMKPIPTKDKSQTKSIKC
jgi:hypothetical protein